MSARTLLAARSQRFDLRVASLFLCLCLLGSFQASGSSSCWSNPEAVPLRVGESWDGTSWRAQHCFVVDLDEAGVLAVEIVQPAATARVYLKTAESEGDAALEILRRSASVLWARVPAGRVGLRVATADRRSTRASFRLQTAFVAEPPQDKGEYDGEIEIEPEDFAGCGLNKGEYDGEIEIEPEDFASPPVPSADLARPAALAPEVLDGLCRGLDGSLLCADPLTPGVGAGGQLGITEPDEFRIYRFEVASVGAVAVETFHRGGDLALELLDRHGLELGQWSADDPATGRVEVLVPGTYFVRLRSLQGARVGYELRVESPPAD